MAVVFIFNLDIFDRGKENFHSFLLDYELNMSMELSMEYELSVLLRERFV